MMQRLSNSEANALFSVSLPDISIEGAIKLSKDSKRIRPSEVRLRNKVLTARILEKDNKSRYNTAFDYDVAAKTAESLGFPMLAIRCRIRACKLYYELGIGYQKELYYATEHLRELCEKYSYEDLEFGAKRKIHPKPSTKKLKEAPLTKSYRRTKELSNEGLDEMLNGNF